MINGNIDKGRVFDAWIMLERLSEGNFDNNNNDNNNKNLELPIGLLTDNNQYNYYQHLYNSLYPKGQPSKSKSAETERQASKRGLIIYYDVFNFNDIVKFIKDDETLKDEFTCNINYGKKFSFVLCFDEDLKLQDKQSFFSVSGYIRYQQSIPTNDEFRDFEKTFKSKMVEIFNNTDGDEEQSEEDKALKFNEALNKLPKLYKMPDSKIEKDMPKCYFQILENIETDATNLHSFFIDDLCKAKQIEDNANLNAYISGLNPSDRINLNGSKEEPELFSKEAFEKILAPKSFPLGRFPSKLNYALAFMQQVAVNLAVGNVNNDNKPKNKYENTQLRSVNGPPGTGKSTLLKDIFAELIVQQAYSIAKAKVDKVDIFIKSISLDFSDPENKSISILPSDLSKNGIVVLSSNNTAVQNIVNEFPLLDNIDINLREEILQIDYFVDIANKGDKTSKEAGNKISCEKTVANSNSQKEFWGLFSMEGGKKENESKILEKLTDVSEYFDKFKQNGESEGGIYGEFIEAYKKVEALRNEYDQYTDKDKFNKQINKFKNELQEFADFYKSEHITERVNNFRLANTSSELMERGNEVITALIEESETIDGNCQNYENELKNAEKRRLEMDENKPGFFNFIERKKYNHEYRDLANRVNEIQSELKIWNDKKSGITTAQKITAKLNRWIDLEKSNLYLDLTVDYPTLQKSHPWFDDSFREIQSLLFISALKVRKQFLYENNENLRSAVKIWGNQIKYLDKNEVIKAAWDWINLAIPVISSTFASFGRMFQNIGSKGLGHVFVDEAGQALPQAAVGAVFRGRDIMMVGDPSQIKPVLTLKPSILNLISKKYEVGEKYISENASAQTLADAASKYGFYRDKNNKYWIGIPLWVHRRCLYPMFTIANELSYGGLMVQGKTEAEASTGIGKIYNVGGKAEDKEDKYVKEQGKCLKEKIQEQLEKDPKLSIYVISPFRNVAKKLKDEFENDKNLSSKCPEIGTIHTFQGKEADVVYLVLGADEKSEGAARWAVKEANMMNVAATRAKKEFYIIGDMKLYEGLDSKVFSTTTKVIDEYNKGKSPLDSEASNTAKEVIDTNNQESSPSCPNCGKTMEKKNGIYGEFWGCSNYPECKYTRRKKK